MTPNEEIFRVIRENLCIEDATINCLLDMATDEAEKTWDPSRGMPKERFIELASRCQLLDLFREAIRYERRHKAARLDSLITEPPAKNSDPTVTPRMDEFFDTLTPKERDLVALRAQEVPLTRIAEAMHIDYRMAQSILASVAYKASRCLE